MGVRLLPSLRPELDGLGQAKGPRFVVYYHYWLGFSLAVSRSSVLRIRHPPSQSFSPGPSSTPLRIIVSIDGAWTIYDTSTTYCTPYLDSDCPAHASLTLPGSRKVSRILLDTI